MPDQTPVDATASENSPAGRRTHPANPAGAECDAVNTSCGRRRRQPVDFRAYDAHPADRHQSAAPRPHRCRARQDNARAGNRCRYGCRGRPRPPQPPRLITAPASESLALGDSPSTSPAPVTTSSAAAAGSSPAASSTPPAASRTINLASGSPALGLSDNLMLAALVAVFALAVIALVTAGGRRGGWRQH